MKDYSKAILEGQGETDYERYMRTVELLSLQRTPDQMIHPDELLFQIVHQSHELWLKLACSSAREAIHQVRSGVLDPASRQLNRGVLAFELITDQLEMLVHLNPSDFQTIRGVLGNGSGFESPGWRSIHRVSRDLNNAFEERVARDGIELVALYRGSPDNPFYRLCEALLSWDDRVSDWRSRHYKIAIRIIGHGVVGTKGTEVDTLTRLINHHYFPTLWSIRTELTETGPMGGMSTMDGQDRQSGNDSSADTT